jgi:PAS domain S-box-containing protein
MKKESENSTSKRAEILVAEDSITQATQIKHLLESQHYKVTVAHDGKEAISELSKHKPSLVISDIIMPEMNGYELCKKIKSNKNTEDIPLILLTRLVDPEEIIEGLSCGADSFVTKPFNEKHLLSNIERILSEGKGDDHIKVPFGVQILFKGKKRFIQAEQQNVIKLMLDIYEGAIHQNERFVQIQEELRLLNERLESLVEDRTSDLAEEIKLSNKIAERLKESEERFRSLYNDAVACLYRTNSQGEILLANRALVKMLGFQSFEELSARNLKETGYAPSYQRQQFVDQIEKKGEINGLEAIWICRDGKEIFVRENAKAIYDSDRKILYYDGNVEDITERKRAEEALRESEEKYRRIFENVQDLYYETSIEGTILELSPSIEILSKGQYRLDDIIGKSMYDFYSDASERAVLLSQIKERGTVSDFEITLKNRDGSHIPCSISAKICFDAQGHPEKIIGSMHDITDRKNATEKLKLAKEKAEASDKLKTSFLNNISHEVRTPLNGILGFAEIMSQTDLTEEEKKVSLSMLFESSDRLLNTITNYMDISLITSGTMSPYKKDFLPVQVLKEIFTKYKMVCSLKNFDLLLKIPEQAEKISIFSDPEILRKIISHLLDNAIKFTEKGSINYGYIVQKNVIEFYVRDTGIGIGKGSIKEVFENFVKEDRGPLKMTEGSGLGLSISKGLVELLGGKIRVKSETGKGSAFLFTIPAGGKIENHIINPSSGKQKRNEKTNSILVAEDDETNFYYLKALLKQNTSAEVIHASNGKEALEIFLQYPDIGLILMDIKMPVMDGLEATRHIKAINRNIPVIAITAYAMAGDEARITDAGCDYYLTKPINKKLLLDKMAEYISL